MCSWCLFCCSPILVCRFPSVCLLSFCFLSLCWDVMCVFVRLLPGLVICSLPSDFCVSDVFGPDVFGSDTFGSDTLGCDLVLSVFFLLEFVVYCVRWCLFCCSPILVCRFPSVCLLSFCFLSLCWDVLYVCVCLVPGLVICSLPARFRSL